jgi:hypothetical protein
MSSVEAEGHVDKNAMRHTGIEQWDLTSTISPFLDRHMIFPLLDYLDKLIAEKAVEYRPLDVSEARLALLRPTHMVDYAIDTYRSIHTEATSVPTEMEQQKAQVLKDLEDLRQRCAPLEQLDATERVRTEKKQRQLLLVLLLLLLLPLLLLLLLLLVLLLLLLLLLLFCGACL